jgi:hypothetical protein
MIVLRNLLGLRQDSSDGVTTVNEEGGTGDKIGSLRRQINGGSR